MHTTRQASKSLDFVDSIILTIDANAIISFINQFGCQRLGFDSTDIIGKNWCDDFIPVEQRQLIKHFFERLIDQNQNQYHFFEHAVLTEVGEVKSFVWYYSQIKNSAGEIGGLLGIGNEKINCQNIIFSSPLPQLPSQNQNAAKRPATFSLNSNRTPPVNSDNTHFAPVELDQLIQRPAIELIRINQQLQQEIKTYQQTAAILNKRAHFDQLINTISTRFIHSGPEVIEKNIQKVLQALGEFSQSEYCSLYLSEEVGPSVKNTYQWNRKGITFSAELISNFVSHLPSKWLAQLNQCENIFVPNVTLLSPEPLPLKIILQANGIQAFYLVPLVIEKRRIGLLVLAALTTREDCSEEMVNLLRLAGDTLANAIQRTYSEQALRESERRFRIMADHIQDGLTIIENRKVTYVNRRACEIFGYSQTELAQMNIWDLIAPEEIPRIKNILNTALKQGQLPTELEFWIVKKSGERRYIHHRLSSSTTSPSMSNHYVVTTDITERKKTEEELLQYQEKLEKKVHERTTELQAANQKLQQEVNERKKTEIRLSEAHANLNATLNALPDILFEVDQHGCIYNFHASNPNDLYVPPDKFMGRRIPEILPATASKIIMKAIEQAAKTGNHLGACYSLNIHDQKKWFELSIARRMSANPNDMRLIVLCRNITNRKQVEEALQIKDFALKSSLNAVVFTDISGKLTYVNPTFCKLWGFESVGEALGKSFISFWHSKEKAMGIIQQIHETGSWMGELVAQKKDNTIFDTHVSANLILNQDGHPVSIMASFIDITQQKGLQAQLIRSERLAATGRLAASVAHEINSPLQAISIMLSVFRQKCGSDPELLNNIDLLDEAFVSIRNTVKSLLDLNRPGKERKQKLNLNSVIQNTSLLLRSYLKENQIQLRLELEPDIPQVFASPQQIGQVILNLLNNAIEALSVASMEALRQIGSQPDFGTILIKTHSKDNQIIMTVVDNGPGIDEEDLDFIFDPFYTSKKQMGMGVGLSICHKIIEDHQGYISVNNVPGGGACFTIVLPATDLI